MKTYTVEIRALARRDLRSIFEWIAEAESVATAERYLDRLERFLAGFDIAPERGTRLRSGRRRIGFERRCTILFRVHPDSVSIERVFGPGRLTPTE